MSALPCSRFSSDSISSTDRAKRDSRSASGVLDGLSLVYSSCALSRLILRPAASATATTMDPVRTHGKVPAFADAPLCVAWLVDCAEVATQRLAK